MAGKTTKPKPFYPLSDVKARIRANDIKIKPNAVQTALDDFRWRSDDIKRCLLKLNDRYHLDDPENNHFYKTEKHRDIPNTQMDYYKARNIMNDENVYIHLYIHPNSIKVVISSLKELQFWD